MSDIKFVPDRVVVGPHGHCIDRGYMEIAGVRIYQDRIIVGPHGQPMLDSGYVEIPGGYQAAVAFWSEP